MKRQYCIADEEDIGNIKNYERELEESGVDLLGRWSTNDEHKNRWTTKNS